MGSRFISLFHIVPEDIFPYKFPDKGETVTIENYRL